MDKYEESLAETSLPTIKIREKDMGTIYRKIGRGSEGIVYRLNREKAFKTFNYIKSPLAMEHKYRKIEYLAKHKDPNFAFPSGLIGSQDNYKVGYFMPLGRTRWRYPTFRQIRRISDKNVGTDLLIKASDAMQRAHDEGLIIGDVKGNNILITKDYEPLFVDTDNYYLDGLPFETIPYIVTFLNKIYRQEFMLIDSDKFLLAEMAIRYLYSNGNFDMNNSKDYYRYLINSLNVSKEIKEELEIIFSDAPFKPYIGPILRRIKNSNGKVE